VAGATPEVVITAIPAGNNVVPATPALSVGQVLGLTFAAGAVFSNSSGGALPGTFAAATDLVVDQNVLVNVACTTTNAGVTTCSYTPPVVGPPAVIGSVAANAIELLPSQFSGIVTALILPADFTIGGLNTFFTNSGVTSVQAQTGTQTTYSGTLTGYGSLTVASGVPPAPVYLYTGYLTNSLTPASPFLFTTNVYGAQ
jgi:hypothetical protein